MNDQAGPTDDFDDWAVNHPAFYAPGSRLDREFRLSRKLVITARRWTNLIDGLIKAKQDQSRARWQTMFAIAFSDPPLTTIALAARLGVQWPTLIRVLDDLERAGMITRTDNPADRRSRWIALTPQGEAVTGQIQMILDPARAEILAALTDEEMELAMRLLDKILARTGTWRAVAAADGAGG